MTPAPISRYLITDDMAVFTSLHSAGSGPASAVLLCPPFGWEEVCAYRSLRDWAAELAAAGHPALRISYPSTGDSDGQVTDPDRLKAWTAAVSAGAYELRTTTGTHRITAVGMGLGGVLAYLATADGAPIDDLVLWGVPARGRALIRQLRALSRMERSICFDGLPEPETLPDGELEAGGFRLSAETVRSLTAVDLNATRLPAATDRHVLLLERDGIAPDADLAKTLSREGAAVTTAAGSGYAAMTSHPQTAEAPREVFATVGRWLTNIARREGPAVLLPTPVGVSTAAAFVTADGSVRETPMRVTYRDAGLSSILVMPEEGSRSDLAVVMLNAGAVRRIGPNRMWVEAARRWARQGVPVLRLDVTGIGDSDGAAGGYANDARFYVPELVPQVLAALDALERDGVARRFVVGGLCAGANWAFHSALRDDRVISALMINPRALVWETHLGAARDLRALINQPFSPARLRRAATPKRRRAVAHLLMRMPRRLLSDLGEGGRSNAGTDADIDAVLDRFVRSGKHALMVFSDHEPLETELVSSGRMERLQRAGSVTVKRIAVRDHTLRPAWAQARAHEALDRALERELGAVLSA